MIRTTRKDLKSLVKQKIAKDISHIEDDDFIEPCVKVAFSRGQYGINGLLVQGKITGSLYAIIGQCKALNLF